MIRPGSIAVVLVSAALLASMMLSNPDYNSTFRPFKTRVEPDQAGKTRLFTGQFDAWRTAEQIAFRDLGPERLRDTQGVFLIVDLNLSGTSTSVLLSATWVGASGRQYETTARVTGVPRQIEDLSVQPGLQSKAIAIFELPPDEVKGGALLLSPRLDAPLDGTLLLAAPVSAPEHVAIARPGR